MNPRSTIKSYDAFTRLLHWVMAFMLFWQLGGMVAEKIWGETPFISAWTGTHGSVGLVILVTALVRLGWAIFQRPRRPAYSASVSGTIARLVHMLFYAAMVIIPLIALIRSIGSGRGLKFFGNQLLAPTGQKIPVLMAPANAAHGLLGWILLVLIIGHIAMALFHHFGLKDATLAKMVPALRRHR
jgi:cytochrome b561